MKARALWALLALLLLAAAPCNGQRSGGGRRGLNRRLVQDALDAPQPQQQPEDPPAAAAGAGAAAGAAAAASAAGTAADPAAAGAAAAANPAAGAAELPAAEGTQAAVAQPGCNNPANVAAQCDPQCEVCQADGRCAPKAAVPCGAGLNRLLAGMCQAGKCVATGCNNPLNTQAQCDEQCETCQPSGFCAPKPGPCGAGPAQRLAGKCAAGKCVATGCNNPLDIQAQCDEQCETCQPNGSCAPKQGPCKAGPAQLWAGKCAAGKCEAAGCNNAAKPQCDEQCEMCQPDGSCAPKQGDCTVNGLKGMCAAGACKPLFAPPAPKPEPEQPQPQQEQEPAAAEQQQQPVAEPKQPAAPQQEAVAEPAVAAAAKPQEQQQEPAATAASKPQEQPQEPAATAAAAAAAADTAASDTTAAAAADAPGPPAAVPAAQPPALYGQPPPPSERVVTEMVPFDVGVTTALGPSARFVVVTWSVSAAWRDRLLGVRLTLSQETATAGEFLEAPAWQQRLVQTRLDATLAALPPSLKERTTTDPEAVTHYRLTVQLAAPTAGPRVKLLIQSAHLDGAFSTPVALTSAA